MQLTMTSDILFRDEVDPLQLRAAAARAFGVASGLVTVTALGGVDVIPGDSRIVMLQEPEDMPGDFPTWYGMSVDSTLVDQAPDAVDAIARSLGTVLLTDAKDEEDMTLHLPDGTRHTVRLAQDDDDAFRITPEMRRLIDGATRHAQSPKAVAS